MRNNILGIIPARFGSSRFPGKPLADIKGKSMIERVYTQSKKAALVHEVVVATDDDRIFTAVKSFGGNVVMTSPEHQSGTDRCVETLMKIPGQWDVVINIQGDEPLIFPEQINQVAKCFEKVETRIATLIKEINQQEDLDNPNIVKVVISVENKALYFSRAPLPFNRNAGYGTINKNTRYFKHVGIYGYRADTLIKIAALPPSMLEISESLEQLRWLENGYEIYTAVTSYENISVDAPDDISQVIKLLA